MRDRMKIPIYAEAEGNPITITNALERPVRDINIFGESVQEGTPSPDSPAEIISIENPTVMVMGKNLFDIDNVKLAGLNAFELGYAPKIENGVLYSGGVTSSSGGAFCYVYCGKKTCTISLTISGSGASGGYYDYINVAQFDGVTQQRYYTGKELLTRVQYLKPKQYNITVHPTKDYVGFAITNHTTQYSITATDIQIEIGDTATEYEPYIAPQSVTLDGITLRGLKNTDGSWKTRDEIIVDGKKKSVKLVKRCWEISLDGNKTWGVYDNVAGYEGFACWHSNGYKVMPEKYTRRTPAFCNQCRVGYGTMWLGIESQHVYWVGTEARQFYDTTLEDKGLANLKAHLNENPLKIVSYYTNPIETDISNTEAGQKLLELYTNKGTTNIFLNSESDLGEIWVRYIRK